MPTCDMGFEHEASHEAEPVVIEADNGPNEHDVEIAVIHAEAEVKQAEIAAATEIAWQEGRVAELEGEVRGMREILDRLAPPEPEPAEPVVVEAAPAPAEPEAAAAPPEAEHHEKPAAAKRGFF